MSPRYQPGDEYRSQRPVPATCDKRGCANPPATMVAYYGKPLAEAIGLKRADALEIWACTEHAADLIERSRYVAGDPDAEWQPPS